MNNPDPKFKIASDERWKQFFDFLTVLVLSDVGWEEKKKLVLEKVESFAKDDPNYKVYLLEFVQWFAEEIEAEKQNPE